MLPTLLAAVLLAAPPDSAFADARTAQLVARAMARHQAADTVVRDYQSRFRYRISFGLGRRRWASLPPVSVEEQEGTIHWSAPNDLRVEILGRRSRARSNDLRINSLFDEPWFVPRGLGDSVRVFGNDFPARAAVHPLAADGASWYHYALTDSVRITSVDGQALKLYRVAITPVRAGAALIVGQMWLDSASASVTRLSFRFVGPDVWVGPDGEEKSDTSDARLANKLINRFLSLNCDLEYAQQDRRYWMPYRQVVAGRVELPFLGELVIPFEATTTFDDYEMNTGRAVTFALQVPPEITDPDSVQHYLDARRDSIRADWRRTRDEGEVRHEADPAPVDYSGRLEDGRYEIHRAPADSLRSYTDWGDSLEFTPDPVEDRRLRELTADLERQGGQLSSDLTGRQRLGFWWERLPEVIRYNRVQGFVPGYSYAMDLSGDGFTTLKGEARFGLSDARVTGALSLVHDGPAGRWTVTGYRQMRFADPFARGNSFGTSLNALFVGHDDADWHLGQGGRITYETSAGYGLELTLSGQLDDERSVRREAESWINDAVGGTGRFPGNPPVREGAFVGGGLRLENAVGRTRWMLGADILAGDGTATARGFGSVRQPFWRGRMAPVITLRSGITTADPLPQQAFRIGGGGTVRGFDYGTAGGAAFWAAQLDVPLRRRGIVPVLFADAGQAGTVTALFDQRVFAGGGVGLSLLGGLLRFDFSHPITKGGSGLRFDLGLRSLW